MNEWNVEVAYNTHLSHSRRRQRRQMSEEEEFERAIEESRRLALQQ